MAGSRDARLLRPEVQELKFTLHRKLLDKINVEALAATDERRVRQEVQHALLALIDGEPALLNSIEREQVVSGLCGAQRSAGVDETPVQG
jgi:hypothetical protein